MEQIRLPKTEPVEVGSVTYLAYDLIARLETSSLESIIRERVASRMAAKMSTEFLARPTRTYNVATDTFSLDVLDDEPQPIIVEAK